MYLHTVQLKTELLYFTLIKTFKFVFIIHYQKQNHKKGTSMFRQMLCHSQLLNITINKICT